ncbi:hypothetical protein [Embleya sp. NPDC059237]|uniref:hypothetical protein n=1 Tax=Embleya sp. NPDC059237 TaxID=3346784 RepID=UPI0036811405
MWWSIRLPATGRTATEHRYGAGFIDDKLDADTTLVGEVPTPAADFEYVFAVFA